MNIEFETLPNNSTLVVVNNPSRTTAAIVVGVGVGSRHEPAGMHGAAHFIEHMFFKGTKRFPTAKLISQQIERLGGHQNAYTDKDHTGFFVTVPSKSASFGVDILHDMLTNPLFKTSDFEKERSVIREEISMYDNDPSNKVWELSDKHVFCESGLAHRITGNIEDVNFSARKLKNFYKKWYYPENTIIILSGNVDLSTIRLASKKFGSIPNGVVPPLIENDTLPPKNVRGKAFAVGNDDRLHIVIRFAGCGEMSSDKFKYDIAGSILGGYSSSRLYQLIREKHGLCYGIWAGHHNYSDIGHIYISLSIEPDKFQKAMKIMKKELNSIRKNGFNKKEFLDTKSAMIGNSEMELDTTLSVAKTITEKFLTVKKKESPYEYIDGLKKVSLNDVQKISKLSLNPEDCHISVVGPKKCEKDVKSFLNDEFPDLKLFS